MATDPAAAAKAIKSAADKANAVKDVPPSLKSDWDAYKSAVNDYAAAVAKMGGASSKDRTDYETKKKELDALKKKIDSSNQGGKAAYSEAMAKKLAYQRANNKIADATRNTTDQKAKAVSDQMRTISLSIERAQQGLASPEDL
jgi:recombinational DNA repair protein RecT